MQRYFGAMEKRVNVFFYGLFMDAELLRTKGLRPTNTRMASVDGFVLHIGQRATLLPDPKGKVYGLLMELTHRELDQLYSEPSVNGYRPEAVIADVTDGSRVPALCFNLPETSHGELPNPEYATKLRNLGRRLGLPPRYIEKIKA